MLIAVRRQRSIIDAHRLAEKSREAFALLRPTLRTGRYLEDLRLKQPAPSRTLNRRTGADIAEGG